VAEASTIDFELARFEHLVETQRGHIVRVSGTWSTPEGRDLPHPTLVAGDGEGAVSVPPLPIPGQDPPRTDGSSPWLASYSIPKGLFADGAVPACRLRPAPDVLIELPELVLPDVSEGPLVPRRPTLHALPDPSPLAVEPVPAAPPPVPEPAAGKPITDLYLDAVRAHRQLVLAIIGVAILGSLIGLALRSPTYRASAQILVTPLPKTDTGIEELPVVRANSDPAQMIDTVSALVRSRDAANATARALGDGWTGEKVLRKIKVGAIGESNVIAVTATSDDKRLAARLANTFAQSSLDQRDARLKQLAASASARAQAQLATMPDQTTDDAQALQNRIAALERVKANGDPTLELVKSAAAPRNAAGLPPLLIVLLTGLAGLVIGVVAAVLLDLVGSARVDSEDDLEQLYPLPILTRLPNLPRRRRTAGAPELREALRTLQVQLELEEGRHRAIMITSASSGDGKTTTALGFALELASAGRAVILVDLDLRKPDIARRLGLTPTRGIEDVVAGRGALADILLPVPGSQELQLLTPAGETDISTLDAVSHHLPEIVEGATALADYVVLDTPPVGEISDALTFARSVDDVLLVCRLGQTPQTSFEAMRDQLERAGARPSGIVVIGGRQAAIPTYPVATGDLVP
jgi:Mrp family chromosome partitioning ATPase/capsular polysaccharide biosynthesis protein